MVYETPRTSETHSVPSPLDRQRVLVTGGAGLVGRRLVDTLASTAEVRVLDHFQTSAPSELPDNVEIVRRNVGNQEILTEALDGTDVVFHQAATSGAYAFENPLKSHEVNATATLKLLDCAQQEDVRTVIASSAAIYGPPKTVPIAEDESKNPLNPYGFQKLVADEYARQYHDLYGLETVVRKQPRARWPEAFVVPSAVR